MIAWDEVLQRDSGRPVKAAGLGRAEHDWLSFSLGVASATQREVHRSATMQRAQLPASSTVNVGGSRRTNAEEELP